MVVTPLAESEHIVAYGEQQAARRAASEQRQAEARARQDYQEAMHTNQWDPTQDPLATSEASAALGDPSGLQEDLTQASAGEALAPLLGPYQVTKALAEEEEPPPESDADGDTLTYIEEQRLGTNPDEPDSDNDQLRDDLEVKGLDFRNPTTGAIKHYYSDPLNADTNNDGVGDLRECWIAFPSSTPPWNQVQTGTPTATRTDIFDGDNDSDSVPDGWTSPFGSIRHLPPPATPCSSSWTRSATAS
jgi:hypothetical protein